MQRQIGVWDHANGAQGGIGNFTVSLTPTSAYLSNGYYRAEILYSSGWWYAYIYNYTNQNFEEWYKRQGGTGPSQYGWDIWEEHGFDEDNWPSIIATPEGKEYKVYVGSQWQYVNNNYGFETADKETAPYNFAWHSSYDRWTVDMYY